MEEERLWDMISAYGDQVAELLQEIEALKNEVVMLKDEIKEIIPCNCSVGSYK